MNPRDPRNRRNRPTPAEGAARLERAADELRAQVVRLPVDSEDDNPDATTWVVPRWLPDVPAAGPVAGSFGCEDCGGRMLEGACLSGCLTPDPEQIVEDQDDEQLLEQLRPAFAAAAADDEYVPVHAAPERLYGWASRHDERSLRFAVRDRLARRVPVQSLSRAAGPILDQGTCPPLSLHDASACTGFAGIAAANALHGTQLGEVEARELYALAQKRDQISGEDYPGTSILGLMKAGQELGYWAAYWWCLGTRDLAQAVLQLGPVVLGVAWSEQLNHPDPRGVAAPGGAELGGHAILCFGVRTDLPGGPHFGLQQSYGDTVGDRGRLWVQHRHLAGMLAGRGEAALPLTDAMVAAL